MPDPCGTVDDLANHLRVAKNSIYCCIEQSGLAVHRGGRCMMTAGRVAVCRRWDTL